MSIDPTTLSNAELDALISALYDERLSRGEREAAKLQPEFTLACPHCSKSEAVASDTAYSKFSVVENQANSRSLTPECRGEKWELLAGEITGTSYEEHDYIECHGCGATFPPPEDVKLH